MLSRRHIRVKVMQALYAIESGSADDISVERAVNSTKRSADRFIDLYYYLLRFLVEFRHLMENSEDEALGRYLVKSGEVEAMRLAAANPILTLLAEDERLKKTFDKRGLAWNVDSDTLRKILNDLRKTSVWSDYVALSAMNAAPVPDLPLALIRDYALEYPSLAQQFEEIFINWHDDRKIVGQMVVKSIQNIAGGETLAQQLERFAEPDPATFLFAEELIRVYLAHSSQLEELIKVRITKWDPSLVAIVDMTILKMATAEFLYFLSIPSTVTINEYIEMAKTYSAPKSRKFVNGVLDVIWKQIKEEGKVPKA